MAIMVEAKQSLNNVQGNKHEPLVGNNAIKIHCENTVYLDKF